MAKIEVYLRGEELQALRRAAARSRCSVAELVRDAIRKIALKPEAAGPVAIWDGKPKRSSVEHDSVHAGLALGQALPGRQRRSYNVNCSAISRLA